MMTTESPSERTVIMTEIERLKRRIELKLQYVELLKDQAFAIQAHIDLVYKEIADLKKQLKDGEDDNA